MALKTACLIASENLSPRATQYASVPMKQSPAPVVSTALTLGASMKHIFLSSLSQNTAPCDPKVMITLLAEKFSRRSLIAASASETELMLLIPVANSACLLEVGSKSETQIAKDEKILPRFHSSI